MVTHWESSRRPLYVRTIWKDGQHHVILDKTNEEPPESSHSRKTKQFSSGQNSHRSTKSGNTGVNLKVSSVRVLLSGVNGFKGAQRSARGQVSLPEKPRTWVKSSGGRPMTCKDLNKEVSFDSVQGHKAPSLRKANTVDLAGPIIEKPFVEPSAYLPNNALSERVLIWLDLAAQNGHMEQEKAVIAQACHILEKPRKISEIREDILNQDVLESSILKNSTPRQDVVKEEMIVISNEEVELPEDDFYHVLTPNVEERSCEEEAKKKKVKTVKRQLHIFMPNLPKRSSDCDSSVLSSSVN